MRQCGGCTLCCKLLPVRELHKGANIRCKHQRTGKGCAVYQDPDAGFPIACAMWSCKWLKDPECADLPRPDRAHYVIDMMPDFVTLNEKATGKQIQVPVLQIWVDPKHKDAHKDPALRRYLDKGGHVALIRYSSNDAFALFPPSITGNVWREERGNSAGRDHTADEILTALEGGE